MAYLKRKRIGKGGNVYLVVAQSYRADDKVRVRTLQYLGNERDVSQADAAKAVAYWNRWTKTRKGRGQR